MLLDSKGLIYVRYRFKILQRKERHSCSLVQQDHGFAIDAEGR